MQGDKTGGFTVFWADEGLDTGPILLQRECDVDPNDTVDTIYNRFLYPEGIKAMVSIYVMEKFQLEILILILKFNIQLLIIFRITLLA